MPSEQLNVSALHRGALQYLQPVLARWSLPPALPPWCVLTPRCGALTTTLTTHGHGQYYCHTQTQEHRSTAIPAASPGQVATTPSPPTLVYADTKVWCTHHNIDNTWTWTILLSYTDTGTTLENCFRVHIYCTYISYPAPTYNFVAKEGPWHSYIKLWG